MDWRSVRFEYTESRENTRLQPTTTEPQSNEAALKAKTCCCHVVDCCFRLRWQWRPNSTISHKTLANDSLTGSVLECQIISLFLSLLLISNVHTDFLELRMWTLHCRLIADCKQRQRRQSICCINFINNACTFEPHGCATSLQSLMFWLSAHLRNFSSTIHSTSTHPKRYAELSSLFAPQSVASASNTDCKSGEDSSCSLFSLRIIYQICGLHGTLNGCSQMCVCTRQIWITEIQKRAYNIFLLKFDILKFDAQVHSSSQNIELPSSNCLPYSPICIR